MSGPDDEEGEVAGEEDVEATDDAGDLEEEEYQELDDEADPFDDADEDLKVVDEVLNHKDQNARALAIRRAIEERLEAKRLSRDLDYLDLDPDSDD